MPRPVHCLLIASVVLGSAWAAGRVQQKVRGRRAFATWARAHCLPDLSMGPACVRCDDGSLHCD